MESVRTQLIREVTISYSCISDAIERIMKGETVQLLDNVGKVKCGIEPIVSKKTMNPNLSTHTQHTECLEGTRTTVLDEVFAWLKNPSSARIFWLGGIAGSGKTAISQSVSILAALLDGHLVISVFFSQFGHAGLCDASSVFQTLAFQLSLLDIGYKERISGIINEYPDIFENDLRVQYEKLIIEPLGAIRRSHSCILITLDGLDECEPHGATAVLKVLFAEDVDHPKGLKILTASRPEVHLRKVFDAQRDIWKRSLGDVETESDIRHYLRSSFDRPPNPLGDPFTISEGTISKLAKRAGNSFIYAATTVRFIFDDHCQDPQKRVDFLLSHRMDGEQRPYAHLDALFLDILQQALPLGARTDEKRRLRTVLGLLVCFREPFPIREMETFYGIRPGDVMRAVHQLHSLVQVQNLSGCAPHIYHRSFTDFVVDPARCPDQNLVVDIGSTERRIFDKCFSLCNLLSQKIVNDLAANDSSPVWRNDPTNFSTQEKYACLYWASHLTNIKDVDEITEHHLDSRCLLRWIETMTVLGMLREAVMHTDQVRTWVTLLKGQADKLPDRRVDLVDNAFSFLPHHATTISYDLLLIYDSALFTSTAGFQLQVIKVERISPWDFSPRVAPSREFSALMPTFKLCSEFVPALAWSPNSQHIAVFRVNGIETWDALSGFIVDSFDLSPPLEYVLDPKKVSCRRLAFYPDNSRIAYVTRGDRVHVRNTLARTEEFVVTSHEGGLMSINVSSNGKLLVSGSKSGRIQVCNADNGALLRVS
ncbi:hypothetical protein EDB86DRAFT_2031977 [Lactarius hatsudake]|nr:hypothetical protein EDB86DRAFT_2031977 [Lactarius hatsudake]